MTVGDDVDVEALVGGVPAADRVVTSDVVVVLPALRRLGVGDVDVDELVGLAGRLPALERGSGEGHAAEVGAEPAQHQRR
nr:hypothetical protein [Demequina litorisediminis]